MKREESLLALIQDLCAERGEIDGVALAHAAGLSKEEAFSAIEQLDAEGLAVVEEYGFSCSVEYTVTGLTEAGRAKLND